MAESENKDYQCIIERLKFLLKNNKISDEIFANQVLNISSRKMRKVLANKVSWNNLTAWYRDIYVKIEKCISNDENLFKLVKTQLNTSSSNTHINAISSNETVRIESPSLETSATVPPHRNSNESTKKLQEICIYFKKF